MSMDHYSPSSVDNADVDRQTSPEFPTIRPNPFEKKTASARKRRRTSGSTSQSPVGEDSSTIDGGSHDSSVDTVQSHSRAVNFSPRIPSCTHIQSNHMTQPPPPQPQSPPPIGDTTPSTKVILSLRRAAADDPGNPSSSIHSTAADTSESRTEQARLCPTLQSSNSSSGDNLDSTESVLHVDLEMMAPPNDTTPISDSLDILSPPEAFPFTQRGDELHEAVFRLARSISAGRYLDMTNLRLLIAWMQSAADFTRSAGRTVLLDTLQMNKRFWAAFPSIVKAFKNYRSRAGESEQVYFAIKEIIALFLQMTAELAKFDHVTLQLVLADESIQQDNVLLFAMEFLYVWHELIQLGKYAAMDSEQSHILATLTAEDIANTLLDPLSESQYKTPEWLNNLAHDFAIFITTKKTRALEFTSIVGIIDEYSRALYYRATPADFEAATAQKDAAAACLRRSGDVWFAMSSAFYKVIDKNPSILANDLAGILIKALTSMLSALCQQKLGSLQGLLDESSSIDDLIQQYSRKYPHLSAELLAKAVPWGWQLSVLSKLIQSGPMHLRVMAVSTLCSSLTEMWNRERDNAMDLTLPFMHHLGQVLERELIDYIIGPSCHPEIIMGSADIMSFLVLSGVRGETVIDRLWQSIQVSQDQRVADAVTRVINSVVRVLNYDSLIHLCSKFERVPIAEFSHPLQDLWEKVMRDTATKAQLQNCPLTIYPYLSALRILREMPSCDRGCLFAYPELQLVAIQRIRELLTFGLDLEVRQELYRICIDDLASKSPTTLGSLWFLTTCIRPTVANELFYLTGTHDIVTKIVEEVESAARVASQKSYCVIFGAANQARRDLISHIVHHQPKTIVDELGKRLWNVLVGPEAPGPADRAAAWQMLLTVGSNSGFQNLFLQTCFTNYLPSLSPEWFCEGLLSFVKENIVLLVNGSVDFNLDDDKLVLESGIEHIWRIILLSRDECIVRSAILLLVCSVYLDSDAIARCSLNTVQNIHVKLVRRCLKLMREASRDIQDGARTTKDEDDSSRRMSESESMCALSQKRREFCHALRILFFFLDTYHNKPQYASADLRSLIPKQAAEISGEHTTLQYQAFDGADNGGAKSLAIGKQNSLASLLAMIRDESGFSNYRAYYRGKQLIPTEETVCKSLEELQMHEGLILVKKEEAKSDMPTFVKPGSSPIEIEVLSHFEELWQYLGMDEELAFEVYIFSVKLPADGKLLERIDCDTASYADLFAPDQPFRSLYAMHALLQYAKSAQSHHGLVDLDSTKVEASQCSRAVSKALGLVCRALDDDSISQNASIRIQRKVCSSLLVTLKRLLDEAAASRGGEAPPPVNVLAASTDRLLRILDGAIQSQGDDSLQLAANCISLIFRLMTLDHKSWILFTEETQFQELLTRLCVVHDRKPFRQYVVGLIEDAVEKDLQNKASSGSMAQYFWNWASISLDAISRQGEAGQEVMKLLYCLIVKMDRIAPGSIDLRSLSQQLSQSLSAHTSTEDIDQASPFDLVANGLANLFHLCLQVDESVAQFIPSTFVWTFLKKHLFPEQPSSDSSRLPRIILCPDTRTKLYECIYLYLNAHPNMFGAILSFLNGMVPFDTDKDDPYLYELPFQFEQSKALRSPAGYVGLINLSNTCYLNSLITQLYMNVNFRDYLLSFDVDRIKGSQMLLYETQRLFTCLQESVRRAVEPSAFVGRIKTYEQGPIDITNQMDVDEFYNLLFDRWEAELPDVGSRKEFRSIYGGQLVQQIKSKECHHISERLEPFSAIQCDIQGMSTLEASLQAYVGGETMDGDNKYKCSSCDRHVDAVKRTCLKDVPDNVIFHLKRFDFDLQTLRRKKIDDYFAFPEKLNLHPYTIDNLSSVSSVDKEDTFELVGVLVHSGTAESGHYYSYVRERPLSADCQVKWVEFNDEAVGIWDPAFLEEATFGGPDRRSVYEGNNNMVFNKSYSAYMLFYQRTSSLKELSDRCCIGRPEGNTLAKMGDDGLRKQIHDENMVLLRRHCLFDPNHARFIQGCVGRILTQQTSFLGMLESKSGFQEEEAEEEEEEAEEEEEEEEEEETKEDGELSTGKRLAVETALSHLDQIFSRTKDSREAVHFCNMLCEFAGSSSECARDVFTYFVQRPAVLRSLLQRNPNRDIRAATSNLLMASLEKLSRSCPEAYYPSSPTSTSAASCVDGSSDEEDKVLPRAIELMNYLWKFFHNHIRAWDEYFSTILRIAQLGRKECEYLLIANYLEKCLTIVTADENMEELGANYVRMLQNVYRRYVAQPPSYVAVMAVISHLMEVMEPEIPQEFIVDEDDGRVIGESGYIEWTAKEVWLLLDHPKAGLPSLFLTNLVGKNQAPEITGKILERVLQAGELPTLKVLGMLEHAIMGEGASECYVEAYIRATSSVITACESIAAVKMIVGHVCRQAGNFRDGEGGAFIDLMRLALNSGRKREGEGAELRLFTLQTIPEWAPYMLQYADRQVREGTEQLVDMCMCGPMDEGAEEGGGGRAEMEMSSELAVRIGNGCLNYVEQIHVRRVLVIERALATVMLRVITNCGLVIATSVMVSDEVKQEFAERRQEIVSRLQTLIVDLAEEEGADWEGSALSSEPMEEAENEEALALLVSSRGFQ